MAGVLATGALALVAGGRGWPTWALMLCMVPIVLAEAVALLHRKD